MKRIFIATSLSMLLTVSISPARAEIKEGAQILSLGLGAGVPLTEIDLVPAGGSGKEPLAGAGFALDGRWLYHATSHIGVGAELGYSQFGDKDHNVTSAVAVTGGSLLTFQAIARYVFLPEKQLSPYLLGGTGFNRLSGHLKATPTTGFVWANTGTRETRTFVDTSSIGAVFSIGAGLEGSITERLLAGLEFKWSLLGMDKDKFGTSFGSALNIGSRFGWKF